MMGVTERQTEVMRVIGTYGPHLTYAAIARLCGIKSTAAKARVEALIKKGCVKVHRSKLSNSFEFELTGGMND